MKTLSINCVCNCAVPGCTGFVLTLQLCFHPENPELLLQATNFSRDYCEVVVFYVFTTSKDPRRRGKAVRWCMKKQPRFKNGVQKKMLPNRIRCPDSNSLNACRFRFCFSFFLRLTGNICELMENSIACLPKCVFRVWSQCLLVYPGLWKVNMKGVSL